MKEALLYLLGVWVMGFNMNLFILTLFAIQPNVDNSKRTHLEIIGYCIYLSLSSWYSVYTTARAFKRGQYRFVIKKK